MIVREVRPQPDQPRLAALAVAATILALPVLMFAGGFSLVSLAGVALAAGLVAAGRDSAHALGALLVLGFLWLNSGANPVTPWTLVMALLMLTIHASVGLRASLPPGAQLGRDLALRWLRRGALVLAITALVYLLGVAVHEVDRGAHDLIAVLAMVLLGGLVLLLRSETLGGARPPTRDP